MRLAPACGVCACSIYDSLGMSCCGKFHRQPYCLSAFGELFWSWLNGLQWDCSARQGMSAIAEKLNLAIADEAVADINLPGSRMPFVPRSDSTKYGWRKSWPDVISIPFPLCSE